MFFFIYIRINLSFMLMMWWNQFPSLGPQPYNMFQTFDHKIVLLWFRWLNIYLPLILCWIHLHIHGRFRCHTSGWMIHSSWRWQNQLQLSRYATIISKVNKQTWVPNIRNVYRQEIQAWLGIWLSDSMTNSFKSFDLC